MSGTFSTGDTASRADWKPQYWTVIELTARGQKFPEAMSAGGRRIPPKSSCGIIMMGTAVNAAR